MKYQAILIAGAALAVAQFGDLPSCGQVCMTNMNSIAVNEFSCTQGDIVCYCQKINYGYGIRDCANQACTSSSDAAAVIDYGSNYCARALSSAAPSSPSAPGYSILSSAAGGTHSGTGPSETGSAGNETGSGGAGATPTPTPVSTLSGTVEVTSGSEVITSTGPVSTLFSTPTGSVAASLSSAASSISQFVSSETSAAASSASATGSAIRSSLTASASASATNSEAAAPIATAAPLLGAGVMAIFLAAL